MLCLTYPESGNVGLCALAHDSLISVSIYTRVAIAQLNDGIDEREYDEAYIPFADNSSSKRRRALYTGFRDISIAFGLAVHYVVFRLYFLTEDGLQARDLEEYPKNELDQAHSDWAIVL